MNYRALWLASVSTIGIMLAFTAFFALIAKYPMYILGVILLGIGISGFAILFVAFYDKYSK